MTLPTKIIRAIGPDQEPIDVTVVDHDAVWALLNDRERATLVLLSSSLAIADDDRRAAAAARPPEIDRLVALGLAESRSIGIVGCGARLTSVGQDLAVSAMIFGWGWHI